MKCPVCGEHTPDAWQFLERVGLFPTGINTSSLGGTPVISDPKVAPTYLRDPSDSWRSTVSVDFMHCANTACGELVMRVHESSRKFYGGVPITNTETWTVRPREGSASRVLDPNVSPEYRRNFNEAASILDRSPRMATVLARRVLADLLEEYAGREEYGLTDRIDAFNEDTSHPAALRRNLHTLREMGDFSAHTKKDDQANIIDVDNEEAEWTLDVIERLFDYFIVTPAEDNRIREGMEEKMKQASPPRKPISPLPDEEQNGEN